PSGTGGVGNVAVRSFRNNVLVTSVSVQVAPQIRACEHQRGQRLGSSVKWPSVQKLLQKLIRRSARLIHQSLRGRCIFALDDVSRVPPSPAATSTRLFLRHLVSCISYANPQHSAD